ncbi:MAG: TetR/AcrR family transcriptional regulator [Wenzhouxiangellaceae bacterium]
MSTSTPQPSQRQPGRPAAEDDPSVRQQLLECALQQVVEHGADKVSLRAIAQAAGVNAAMVHYYFGNRAGLLEAMLDHALQPLLDGVSQWQSEHGHSAAAPELPQLMQIMTRTIARHPWIPVIVLREVLGKAGPFRERFIEHFASRGRGLITTLLQEQQRQGQLRADLDPQLTTLSVISLVMFPFLTLPVSSRVYGVSLDDEFVIRLLQHNQQLLWHGVRP